MTTMLEVAKRAGVSKVTASRVPSGDGYISQETKDHVLQAVEESGHRPNLLVRNLSAKSTQTLGLAVTNTPYRGIYSSKLLFHAARMAEEKGRQLPLADGKHSAEEERQAIRYLLNLRCNAIIIYSRFLSVDEIDDIIDAHSQPIMVLNRRLRKNNSHSVWCDHRQISFNVVAELINAGHQEIAFLTGLMDSPISIERLAGYKDVLVQHGIALNERLIANDRWTPINGAEGVEMLLERGVKFSVLVASDDDMAMGTMEVLHGRGVVVPERVSAIGLDDIATAPYTVPALSSAKIPVTEVIQEIIEWLIPMLDGGDFSLSKTFSGKLIRRGSFTVLSR